MLNAINAAINTKILLAILGVLGVIATLLIHQQHEVERAAAASAKAATVLQQQQRTSQEQQRQEDAFKAKVEAEKRKHSSSPANESKTWQTYRP